MHHNIAAYEAAVRRHVTVLIAWGGEREDLLREAIRSLPKGVRVCIAQNAGKHEMALALNEALKHITTKYTFIMGSDDVVDSKTLWRLWEAAIGYDGAYPWMLGFGEQRFRMRAEPWCPLRIQDKNVCGVFLVRTSALRDVGGYRDVPIEDWDLVYRLANKGYRLAPAPLARYGYRQRSDGLHRTTVREAAKLEMTWADLAPYEERVSVPAVFYEWRLEGTGYVRCELPARTTGSVVRLSIDADDAHQSRAWVFQYPNDDAREFWELAKKLGKKRVIDVDDNYLSADLANVVGRYHEENGRLWGENQSSHKRMVAEADYVICATDALAEVYSRVNPNVVVCENTVDPIDWPEPNHRKKIVGCVLSANHLDHTYLVEDAMRYASMVGAEVQVVGLDPDWDFPYTHFGFTPSVASYRRVLSRWSVGLAPIVENDVTRGKSDLKWLEFTMCGAALVASDVEAYKRVPDDSIIRVDDAEGFAGAVGDLLHDERERRRMVRSSAFHVKRDRLVGNEVLRSKYTVALA